MPEVGPLLLYVLPIPLLPAMFIALGKGQFGHFVGALGAFALLVAAALMARRGLRVEAEAKRRKWIRSTRVPFKLVAACLAGAGTALGAWWVVDHSALIAICFALGAAAGVLLNYGLDPQHAAEEAVGPFGVTSDEVLDALEEAEKKLERIDTANRSIRNPELSDRLRRITAKAREILQVIEEDPRDLRRARKFLKVYLDGTQRVTEGYARTHTQQQNDMLEDNFRNVLTTIEDVFGEQHQKLIENDVLDLDVQIEVLITQLKREGVI